MKKRRDLPQLSSAPAQAVSWFRERFDWQPLGRWAAKKVVPLHRHSWIYTLGGAALFLFALQVATGCLLMLYYQPAETTAHESVQRIVSEVPYGWLVRSMHAWGASLFIGVVAIHFLSILFSKTYRKPRELTWLSGTLMLFLALAFGFSGYLLPWNELSYYATLVGTKIPGAIPLVGDFLVQLLRGGQQVSGATITRLFAMHVAILPLAFGGLLALHVMLVQVQGMGLPLSLREEDVCDRRPFFSEFLLSELCLWLLLFGAIVTLAVFWPTEVGEKANLLKPAPEGIKPEWYFLFLFKTLKLVPETLGVALFALAAFFFLLLPFLDRNASREKKSPVFTATFVLLLLYAATFEILAWRAPGVQGTPPPATGVTRDLTSSVVTLLFLWAAIGFLLYYLRRLRRENARAREYFSGSA